MTDVFSKEKRSWIMSRVRDKHTFPEKTVRSTAHRLGYRFRLHRKNLPGKPDLVFSSRRKVIFVHGCFWHGHKCPRGDRTPKTNESYWREKIQRNVLRYEEHKKDLTRLGWKILTIWECEIKKSDQLKSRLISFLEDE